ncbi:related to Protein GVP36 [Zygosaccharomyces bailii ISA1307]|nr:related to Protein GVP36 [Zygosaccharomyces bailii ISA1307]
MSFNKFTEGLNEKFQQLSTAVSGKAQEISQGIPTTHRLMQEKLGQVTDISQMPQEYVELEAKIDAIKLVYNHFLQVTQVYDNESYDYPKYVNESINEFSRTVGAKLQELSRVSSAHEAQTILSTPNPAKEPKTLNYALSRVSLVSSECLNHLGDHDDALLASYLMKYSDTQSRVAQARLHQDSLIQANFNERLRENIEGNLKKAHRVRKEVENKRLQYDVSRSNLENARPEKEAHMRVQMETAEEEFAQATEHATIVMQEVIATTDFLPLLHELAAAQYSYHQSAAQRMEEFLANFPGEEEERIDFPAQTQTPAQNGNAALPEGVGISLSDEADDRAGETAAEKSAL